MDCCLVAESAKVINKLTILFIRGQINPILHLRGAFPFSFFVINPFRKKIFISNEFDFESKFIANYFWKYVVAKVKGSIPIFDIPKSALSEIWTFFDQYLMTS